jgi:trimeric autotransporter adhesin
MKKFITIFVFLLLAHHIHAQSVGIGTTTPNTSAALEIKSSTKGLLIPVMDSTSRKAIATPANGLMLYDSSAKAFYYYKKTAWKSFAASGVLIDADGNTSVEVERTPNDDIVRITTAGTDHTLFNKNNTGAFPVINYPANGSLNLLIGTNSGFNLKAGHIGNTFVGIGAGYNDSTGDYNTSLGENAGWGILSGSRNTNLGAGAGMGLQRGTKNVNIGMLAGWNTVNTHNTIHIGYESGYLDSATNNNIAIGSSALYKNYSDATIAIGTAALANNNYGMLNLAIGDSALFNNGIGKDTSDNSFSSQNTAIGNKALYSNTNGNFNTATGYLALKSNTIGSSNTANGNSALFSNTIGSSNIANGNRALYSNTTGSANIAIGEHSLNANISGNDNTALGSVSLANNTIGYSNVAIGRSSLAHNIAGNNNTATGFEALTENIGGNDNTATGFGALKKNTSGFRNTAVGYNAISGSSYGYNNCGFGYNAGPNYFNFQLYNSTFIGANSNGWQLGSALTNATAIGANALVERGNAMVLGSIAGINGASSSINVGIGTTDPISRLHVVGDGVVDGSIQLRNATTPANYGVMQHTGIGGNFHLDTYGTGGMYLNWFKGNGVVIGNGAGTLIAAQFFTNGNLTIAGTLTQNSDARLKKNITPIQNSLATLQNIKAYTYNWIDETKDTTLQIGVLAQEVQKIYPQLVRADDKGMLSINYTGFVPLLINGMKEQQVQIDKQQKQIDELKILVNTLIKK